MENGMQNVTLHIDVRVWKEIKIMAAKEETTISGIVGEALAAYVKWLKKAELDEEDLEGKEEKEKDLARVRELCEEMKREKAARKMLRKGVI